MYHMYSPYHGKFWKSNIAISVKISEVDLSRAPKWIVFPPSRVQAGNCSRFVVGSESEKGEKEWRGSSRDVEIVE